MSQATEPIYEVFVRSKSGQGNEKNVVEQVQPTERHKYKLKPGPKDKAATIGDEPAFLCYTDDQKVLNSFACSFYMFHISC